MSTIPWSECQKQDGSKGKEFWVVVDSYVLDLTSFLQHHPGSKRKIVNKRREVGPLMTSNFLDHFGHTVRAFREACQQYEATQAPVVLRFPETGQEAKVLVIGKIE